MIFHDWANPCRNEERKPSVPEAQYHPWWRSIHPETPKCHRAEEWVLPHAMLPWLQHTSQDGWTTWVYVRSLQALQAQHLWTPQATHCLPSEKSSTKLHCKPPAQTGKGLGPGWLYSCSRSLEKRFWPMVLPLPNLPTHLELHRSGHWDTLPDLLVPYLNHFLPSGE